MLTTPSVDIKIASYLDLLKVPLVENNEPFVFLDLNIIPNGYLKEMNDMEKITGKNIPVRKIVRNKLLLAQKILFSLKPELTLFVSYGFRSLEVQISKFLKILKEKCDLKYFENPSDLYQFIHTFVAFPLVAGHPTGGAVDVFIKNRLSGEIINFGSEIYNYDNNICFYNEPNVSKEAKENRKTLRTCMFEAGFSPYNGEWWHFSYGDREWAFNTKQKSSIYSQKSIKELNIT